MARRKKISSSVRVRVLARNSFRCVYCGASATDGTQLVLDHVVPYALGGPDEEWNLVTACHECNTSKGKSMFLPEGTTCGETSHGAECDRPATAVVGYLDIFDVYPTCEEHAQLWVKSMRVPAITVPQAGWQTIVTRTNSTD